MGKQIKKQGNCCHCQFNISFYFDIFAFCHIARPLLRSLSDLLLKIWVWYENLRRSIPERISSLFCSDILICWPNTLFLSDVFNPKAKIIFRLFLISPLYRGSSFHWNYRTVTISTDKKWSLLLQWQIIF